MRKTNSKSKPDYPLFRRFSVGTLSDRTGYSIAYLLQVKMGYRKITPLFKLKMSRAFDRSEEELFGGDGK